MSRREFMGESQEVGDQSPVAKQNAASPALRLITILAFCLAAGAAFWLFSALAVRNH